MHFPHQNAQVCSKHACKKPFINMTGARTLETLSGCCQLLLFGCSQIQTLLFVQFFTHSKNRGRPIHSHRDVQRLGPVLTEHVNVIIPPHTMRKLTFPASTATASGGHSIEPSKMRLMVLARFVLALSDIFLPRFSGDCDDNMT